MLITTLLLAAMVQSSPAATVATTRVAFTKCLRDDMKKALEAKVEDVQYEMQVKSNCGTERDAFRKAVIALGRASGDSEQVATEDADLQIEDYHANFTEKFKDYKSTNTMPGE
ncbi:hypothetical protein [Sphingopyxis sp.]|uniref:hypothetical protein n=1 Tax=Sphingopyxis sp. TaxID=1908224 RepID=UPI002D77A3D8|nr:hypothetical protein [Sphingopyxis sp.]HET6524308.1 hypothetical protein [Sphingopyxis sp.]